MSYNKSQFSNSNGVTFGTATNISGNVITASHNGLTTAMASNAGSNFMGTNTALTANGVSMTANSSGLSLNFPAFLTTAQPVGAYLTTARASNDAIGLNTAQSNVTWTVNSSGISFDARGYAGTGTTFAGTNVSASATLNSNGLNLALSAAAAAGGGAAIKGSGTYTQNTGTVEFANSNGITFGLSNNGTMTASHNGITQQSTQPVAISGSNGSFAFSTVTFGNLNGASFYTSNGSVVASYTVPTVTNSTAPAAIYDGVNSITSGTIRFTNANGVSFSINGQTLSASVNTSYRASNDAVGLNTAQSNVTWTVNSSGISFDARGYAGTNTAITGGSITVNSGGVSLNLPAYLTTAMASNAGSNFVGLNSAVTGASLTVNSSGISINVPAAAPSPVYVEAGTTNGSLGTISFANSNGVSFGLNGSTITASAAGGGGGVNIAASNTTFTSGTVQFNGSGAMTVNSGAQAVNISVPATSSLSATGQVSISVNGSTISIGVPNALTKAGYAPYADLPLVAHQQGAGTLQFDPDWAPNVAFDRIVFPMAMSNASNSSGSQTLSFWAGIYTRTASSLSLLYSASASTAVTQSGTAGSYSLMSGMRNFTMGLSQTLTEGQYWLAFVSRTTSGGANASFSNMAASNVNSNFVGFFGSSHNTTYQLTLGRGVYTATTSGMPASVAFTQIRGSDSAGLRPAALMFASSTI